MTTSTINGWVSEWKRITAPDKTRAKAKSSTIHRERNLTPAADRSVVKQEPELDKLKQTSECKQEPPDQIPFRITVRKTGASYRPVDGRESNDNTRKSTSTYTTLQQCSRTSSGIFCDLPGLLEGFALDVALAYFFSRVELAHNMALYCGVVKIHNANKDVAGPAVDASHMTRESFQEIFKTIFNRELPSTTRNLLKKAEEIRDRVMHGKRTLEREKREAIAKVIDSAAKFNEIVYSAAWFRPFGNLRGFHGRGESLSKARTRWILKGMGFSLS